MKRKSHGGWKATKGKPNFVPQREASRAPLDPGWFTMSGPTFEETHLTGCVDKRAWCGRKLPSLYEASRSCGPLDNDVRYWRRICSACLHAPLAAAGAARKLVPADDPRVFDAQLERVKRHVGARGTQDGLTRMAFTLR